jgi:hypothetical protein
MIKLFGSKPKVLKYLFEVEFKDGTVYKQTLEDKSIEGVGSAFTDIVKRINDIRIFTLRNVKNKNCWSVDLITGEFYHNGYAFQIDDCLDQLIPKHLIAEYPKKLIYFRQHQHDYNMQKTELAHRIRYFIGYEFDVMGKKYQRKISIS